MTGEFKLIHALIWPTALAGVLGAVVLVGAVLVGPADAASAHAGVVFQSFNH